MRCFEVDVQRRIQATENSELFLQSFLKFLAFCLDLSIINYLFDLLQFFKWIRIGFVMLVVTKDLKFIVLKGLDVIFSHSAALHFWRLSVSENYEKCLENLMHSKLNLLNERRQSSSDVSRVWKSVGVGHQLLFYYNCSQQRYYRAIRWYVMYLWFKTIFESCVVQLRVESGCCSQDSSRVELRMGTCLIVSSMCVWTCSCS